MRRTKIVCTIGPASAKLEVVKELIHRGMDVARLNFSHGSLAEHEERLAQLREAGRQLGKRVGILMDTRGPEVRLGTFRMEEVELKEGQYFTLTTEQVEGDDRIASVNYRGLPGDLTPGTLILIDDGIIALRAEKITGTEIICRVEHGGKLSSRKSINLPGVSINLPVLSQEDIRDINFALTQEADFLAVSFIRCAADVMAIRQLVEENRGRLKIIAKIENEDGVNNFTEILEVADGIMIARGDLGVEIPAEDVPLVQKKIIAACNAAGKPVITATQMLDSMIRHPRPTRAEASDVANAIFDGTDAVMLSGETAAGMFPLEAVATMARIALRTEEALEYKKILDHFEPHLNKTITETISYATCRASQELGAKAIISSTQSGYTARMVSKYKPRAPIIAVTPNEKVAAELTLTWGVFPLLSLANYSTDEVFDTAVKAALEAGLISNGDLVIFTAGVPVGVTGTTNYLRIETVGEVIMRGQGVGRASASGEVYLALTAEEAQQINSGQILVTRDTDEDYISAMGKAAAVITERGGLTSHAAITGIELGIPVVVGVDGATARIASGQVVTVDALRGLIYSGRVTVY
ncbi:MAG: pyruvate kinase [Bacillota bacterium]